MARHRPNVYYPVDLLEAVARQFQLNDGSGFDVKEAAARVPEFLKAVQRTRPAAGRKPLGVGFFGYEDEIEVPQYSVAGSMGDGSFPSDHIDVVRGITVSIGELRRQATFTNPENLQFITGYGNSMEPTFKDGDILLVDRGVRMVTIDAVYVFTLGTGPAGRLYIKGLQQRQDGLLMISHNRKAYEPELIRPETPIEIHGRVVLAWNANRL